MNKQYHQTNNDSACGNSMNHHEGVGDINNFYGESQEKPLLLVKNAESKEFISYVSIASKFLLLATELAIAAFGALYAIREFGQTIGLGITISAGAALIFTIAWSRYEIGIVKTIFESGYSRNTVNRTLDKIFEKAVQGKGFDIYDFTAPCSYYGCRGIIRPAQPPEKERRKGVQLIGRCNIDSTSHTYIIDANGYGRKADLDFTTVEK